MNDDDVGIQSTKNIVANHRNVIDSEKIESTKATAEAGLAKGIIKAFVMKVNLSF
ncbi:hypothetical protein ACLOJK_041453 [Asimina triloba]